MVSLSQADPSIVERTINEEEKRIHALVEHLNSILKSHNVRLFIPKTCRQEHFPLTENHPYWNQNSIFQINGEVIRIQGGNPGHQIVHKTKEMNVDILVTGSRGLGKIRRTLMGSVSDFLVHHSHIPVLVYRHDPHEHDKHQWDLLVASVRSYCGIEWCVCVCKCEWSREASYTYDYWELLNKTCLPVLCCCAVKRY